MPDADPLPLGWFEHVDPASGRPYYHNQASGETSWTRPTPEVPQDRPPPPTQPQPTERAARKPSTSSAQNLFAAADAKLPVQAASPVASASKETAPHRLSTGRSVPSRPAAPLPPRRTSITSVGGRAPSFVPPPSRPSGGGASPPRSQGSTSPSSGPQRRPSTSAGSPRASSSTPGLVPKSRLSAPQTQRFLSMYNKSDKPSAGRGAGRPSNGSSMNSSDNRSHGSHGSGSGGGSNSRSREGGSSGDRQPSSEFEEKSPGQEDDDDGNRERLSSAFVPETENFAGGARPLSMDNPLAAKPRESPNANPTGLDAKAMHRLSTASSVLTRASIHDFDFPRAGNSSNNSSGSSSSGEGSSGKGNSGGAARGTAEEAKALFKRVDKNGDGALEFNEVALLLAEAGLESSPERTAGAMREMLLAGGSVTEAALDDHSSGSKMQDVTLEDFTAWYASDSSGLGMGSGGDPGNGGGAGGGVMSISAALALQEEGMANEAEELEEDAVSLRASLALATESKERRMSSTFGGAGLRFSSALAAVPEPAALKGSGVSHRPQPSSALRKAEGEYRRMSLVITSSSSEAVLEVFSELTNMIGRLRTTLLAAASNNYQRAPSHGQGAGGISYGDLGSSLKSFGGSSSNGGSSGSSSRSRSGGHRGGGVRGGAQSLLGRLGQDGSARDFAKSLSKIGAALHSSLQVLDAIRALQEPADELNPQASSSASSMSSEPQLFVGSSSPVRASQWARFAARFKEDLSSARDQLGEVAILLADICGPSASLEATTLVDTMVERIGRRVSQLGLAVEAAQVLEDTAKQNKMKLLEEEFAAEAEVERQQMIKETAVISQKCHRSGELEKQPIVQRELATTSRADAAGAEDSLSFADSRSKGGGGGSGGAGFLRAAGSALAGSLGSSKSGGEGKSGSWQTRYFFLDYQSLLYTENTKAAKQAQEAAAAAAKASGGAGSMSQHAAVSLPSSWRPDDANATKLLLDHTSEAKLAPRNDRSNSGSGSGSNASQGSEPTVFVLSHATYELPIRAPSMDEALAWIEAINKCASVHRSRYDKTRQWFIKKSQAQWWGSLLPDPRAVSVKNWERLFKSVVHVSSQSENGRQVNAIMASPDQPNKGSSSPGGSAAASSPSAAAGPTSPTALSRVELGEDVQSASVEGLRCRLGMRCKGHGDHVTVVAWSSDGRHVVSGSKESKVLVWAVPNTNLLELGTRDTSGRGGDSSYGSGADTLSSSPGSSSFLDGRSASGIDSADAATLSTTSASRVGFGELSPAEAAKAMTMGLKPAEELAMGREANWTMACCFSPSNRRVAVAGLNQKISVGDWRFQHGRNYALHPVGNGDEHLGSVTSLCFMGASDTLLASGCSDSYLRVWDLGGTGKMVTRLSAQEDEVLCLAAHAWAPHLVMSGGADCVVRLHDVRLPNGPSTVCTLRGAESDVEDVRAFGASSTTANFLAAASRDGHLRVHDVRFPKAPAMKSIVTEPRGYTAVDFSPDGRWLFAAVAGGHAWQVMDAYTGRIVLQVRGHGGVVSCLRATNDGRVITGGDDHQLCVWNVDTPHFW